MAFSILMQDALEAYDKKKEFLRKTSWIPWLFNRDARAIRALRKLQPCYQNNAFAIFNCFIKNGIKKTQDSYSVFQAFIQEQFSKASSSNCEADLYLEIGLKLNKAKIFTEQNLQVIQKHPNFEKLAAALQGLDKEKILNQDFFNAIKEAPDPVTVTEMFLLCKKKSLLNDQNKNTVITHYQALKLIRDICEKRNISFYECLETIINHPHLPQLWMALQALEEAQQPNQELVSLITDSSMTKRALLDCCHNPIIPKKTVEQEQEQEHTINQSDVSTHINHVPITSDNNQNNNKTTPPFYNPSSLRRNVLFRLCDGDEPAAENKQGPSSENITQPLHYLGK